METLKENNQDRCEHPIHCLILVGANCENPMDKDWSWDSCTLRCLKCDKLIKFFTKQGTYYCNYYRDGVLIKE
jgi:hypothetical protein